METKILIIGGSSFLAQNYINFDKKNKLTCLVRNKKNLIKKKNVSYINSNIISKKLLKKIILEYKINTILNFVSNNNNSLDKDLDNYKIFSDNVITSLKILEIIKFLNIKYICFDSFERKKNKNSAYILAKKVISDVNNFYEAKYNIKIISVVLPTVIGKFDTNKNRIIPFLSENNKLKKPNYTIVFAFAEDIVNSIKNNIENNKKIKFKIYKKKASFFLNRFLDIRKLKRKSFFLSKINEIFSYYKKNR